MHFLVPTGNSNVSGLFPGLPYLPVGTVPKTMTTVTEAHLALAEECTRLADITDQYANNRVTSFELRLQEARVYRAQAVLHQALAAQTQIETS
jgi:hypothetical protein